MAQPKNILLKLTGDIITQSHTGLNADFVRSIALQIKQLTHTHQFSIVIGGGNFFRGATQGAQVEIRPQVAHTVGMLATMMNGLIIQDIFEQIGIKTVVLNALSCPEVGEAITFHKIQAYQAEHKCLIFTGGTGNPFFTTDTTAVLRALQVNAQELWKATKVAGIYTQDPRLNPDAQLVKKMSFAQALEQKLGIMDLNAFVLAEQHAMPIRIFNLFDQEALVRTASDINYGSTIQ
jgi:uridylate kinase